MKQLPLFGPEELKKLEEQKQDKPKKTGKKKPRKKKKKLHRKPAPVVMRFCKRCLCRIDADKIPVCNAVCAFCFRDDEVSGGFLKWFTDHFHALEPLEKSPDPEKRGQVKEFGELVCQYQQADRCARIAIKYLESEHRDRKQAVLAALDRLSFPPPTKNVFAAWRARIRPQIKAARINLGEPVINWQQTKYRPQDQEDYKLPTVDTKRKRKNARKM